jgi:dolichol-phosphate mannosyltransferase
VVLPTLNEAENLPWLLPQLHATLPRAEVLVVDDHSPDGTGQLAEQIARSAPWLHVEHRLGPPGLGPAYQYAFNWALQRGYAAVVQMDCDGSHPPRFLPDLLGGLGEADLVLGCRYMPGGAVSGWGLHRRLLSRGGNLYAQAVLGLPFRDLTGGFKAFHSAVLADIDFPSIRTRGYGFQIEVTWRALQRGYRVVERPIHFPDRERGQSKLSLSICGEALAGVWRMRASGG